MFKIKKRIGGNVSQGAKELKLRRAYRRLVLPARTTRARRDKDSFVPEHSSAALAADLSLFYQDASENPYASEQIGKNAVISIIDVVIVIVSIAIIVDDPRIITIIVVRRTQPEVAQ